MKKIVVLTLILTLLVSVLSMMPFAYAKEDNVTKDATNSDITETKLITSKHINNPIGEDGIDYYIDLKHPDKFASLNNVLIVQNGEDGTNLLFKIDSHILNVNNALDKSNGTLNSITIIPTNEYNGYFFLNFELIDSIYETHKTHCYKYKYDPNATIEKNAIKIDKIGLFSDYINDANITGSNVTVTDLLDSLDNGITHMYYANEYLYTLVNYNNGGALYKIGKGNISKVELYGTVASVATSKHFAVNNQTFFIYDNNNYIWKRAITADTPFERVTEVNNIKDMQVTNTHLYLLTDNKLMAVNVNSIKDGLDDINKRFEMTLDEKYKYNSIGLSTANGINFIGVTETGSSNITTYKETLVPNTDKITLEFYNHYGSNCACTTPHQHWFNAPTNVSVSLDNSLIYVVDNYGERIVALREKKNNFTSYFFDRKALSLDANNDIIKDIDINKSNVLYVAVNDRINTYKFDIKHDNDKESVTTSLLKSIVGFDGNIVDIYISNSFKSTTYVLTDKNSVYIIEDGASTPKLITTFSEELTSIAPSNDDSRIYVSTSNSIKSYPISNIDKSKPLTTLDFEYGIKKFNVDYKGNLLILADNSRLYSFIRNDNKYDKKYGTYYKNAKYNSTVSWRNLQDFVIVPSNIINETTLYTVDSSTNRLERDKTSGIPFMIESHESTQKPPFNDEENVYIVKAPKGTRVYKHLNNYEMYRTLDNDEYFLLLGDIQDTTNNILVDSANNYCYIDDASLTRINATNKSNMGTKFVSLSETMNIPATIYRYPFDPKDLNDNEENKSIYIKDNLTDQMMTFVDNVAYDENNETSPYVWQNSTTRWLKVKYTKDDIVHYGYVKDSQITPYEKTTAPSTSIFLRVTNKAGGRVSMYATNDLKARILVDNIPDGTLVRLRQNSFDKSQQFTLVELEKDGSTYVGYILTSALQENKITNLQVVAIIITVVTVLITICVIVLIVVYKKKKNRINTFKDDSKIK